MDNPLDKKGLIEEITELREEVKKRLLTNIYYVALNKLDEMLAVIQRLESMTSTPPESAPPPKSTEVETAPLNRSGRDTFRMTSAHEKGARELVRKALVGRVG
jgi:hypothetical protein